MCMRKVCGCAVLCFTNPSQPLKYILTTQACKQEYPFTNPYPSTGDTESRLERMCQGSKLGTGVYTSCTKVEYMAPYSWMHGEGVRSCIDFVALQNSECYGKLLYTKGGK